VLVGAELPVHHLLVVELELDVAARGHEDLRLKRLRVLGVRPKERRNNRLSVTPGSFWGKRRGGGRGLRS